MSRYRFQRTAVGGTFDHLHEGHKVLLDTAYKISRHVIIGVASDELVIQKPFFSLIEDFSTRKKAVKDFLAEQGFSQRSTILRLKDPLGVLVDDVLLECVVVTKDTKEKAKGANIIRQKSGMVPFEIVVAPYILSTNGTHISSTRIRKGEMNRNGFVYEFQSGVLPEKLALRLRQPLGTLVSGDPKNPGIAAKKIKEYFRKTRPFFLASVGDVTTSCLVKEGVKIDLAVFDGRVQRKKKKIDFDKILSDGCSKCLVRNPAGMISLELTRAIKKIFSDSMGERGTLLQVEGEEDLSVLPIGLFAPLTTVIVYGQPKKGMVVVEVDEKRKEVFYKILSSFAPM